MKQLWLAAACHPNPERVVQEGIWVLEIHRSNCNLVRPDPTHFQLLWCKFPREHWDGLCEGSELNFLTTLPIKGLQPNADMDEEQQAVAGNFMDELVEWCVFGWAPGERPAVSHDPIFWQGIFNIVDPGSGVSTIQI
jgi:hypothetical protein